MNTGVGKLHQMLFYAGLEPEEYQACLPEIRKDNRKKLRAYLIIAGIFLLVIICLLLAVLMLLACTARQSGILSPLVCRLSGAAGDRNDASGG